jgi:hypothetical protein
VGRAGVSGACGVSLSNIETFKPADTLAVSYLQGALFSCGMRKKGTPKVIYFISLSKFQSLLLTLGNRKDIKEVAGGTTKQDRRDKEKNKLLFD